MMSDDTLVRHISEATPQVAVPALHRSAELEDIVPPLHPPPLAHSANVSLGTQGSIPSAADLYGGRRTPRAATATATTTPTAARRDGQARYAVSNAEAKQQNARDALHTSAFIEDGSSGSSSSSDDEEEEDNDEYAITSYHNSRNADEGNNVEDEDDDPSLRRRMRRTERLFDRRVRQINAMLHAAGHQLVLRKEVIAALQAQLAQLQAQLHSAAIPAGAAQDALLRTTRRMMHQLQREERRAAPLLPPGHEAHARHSCPMHHHHHHSSSTAAALAKKRKSKKYRKRMTMSASHTQSKARSHTSEEGDVARRRHEDENASNAQSSSARQAFMPSEREAWLEAQLAELTRKHAAALRAQEQRHRRELHAAQRKYNAELAELNAHFARLDTQLRRRTSERDGLAKESEADKAHTQTRIHTLEEQLALSQRRRQRAELELGQVRTTLQDEVDAVRLSMARLLQLLSEVPAMRAYLRWNEIDSEFVFLGYPTRYFSTEASTNTNNIIGGRGQQAARDTNHAQSYRSEEDEYESDEDEQRAAQHRAEVETGVAAGVYGGTATAQTSQNVWLNGRWLAALQSILQAQNLYTKLRKIKLFEMAQAAQVAEEGLPNTQDLLHCRRPEKDYWVPYRVFVEAQRFKNAHYIKLPAMAFFYPFLLRLNKIWCGRLHDRLRVWRTTLREREQTIEDLRAQVQQQQQQQRQKIAYSTATAAVLSHTRPISWRQVSARRTQPHRLQQPVVQRDEMHHNSDVVMSGEYETAAAAVVVAQVVLQQHLRQMRMEHHALQRQVRLQVCSPRSLQLFRAYDALVKQIITGAERELQRMASTKEEEERAAAQRTRRRPATYKYRSTMSSAHDTRSASLEDSSEANEQSDTGSNEDDDDDDDDETYDRHRREQRYTTAVGRTTSSATSTADDEGGEEGEDEEETTIEQLLCLLQDTCAQVDELAEAHTTRLDRSCGDFTTLLAQVHRTLRHNTARPHTTVTSGDDEEEEDTRRPLLSAAAMERLVTSAIAFADDVRRETRTMAESVRLVSEEALQIASGM